VKIWSCLLPLYIKTFCTCDLTETPQIFVGDKFVWLLLLRGHTQCLRVCPQYARCNTAEMINMPQQCLNVPMLCCTFCLCVWLVCHVHSKMYGRIFMIFTTPTESVSVGSMFASVCLFHCLERNSKVNDPKVFKFGRVNIWDIIETACCCS